MKVTRHTPNLVRLTRLGMVNAFLVVEDDGLTLVDTMLPRSQDAILAAARDLGKPIARIVLTHAHSDHVGSLDALAAALPNATVAISARDARFLAGRQEPRPGRAAVQAARRLPEARDEARPAAERRATASARSRSSRRRATPRATSRSSTRATAR